MPPVDQTSWDAAVRHLYEGAYACVATGPRHHEDWALDVLTVMARVPDPRDWAGVDDAAQSPEREGDPKYPFADHPPEYVAPRLKEAPEASSPVMPRTIFPTHIMGQARRPTTPGTRVEELLGLGRQRLRAAPGVPRSTPITAAARSSTRCPTRLSGAARWGTEVRWNLPRWWAGPGCGSECPTGHRGRFPTGCGTNCSPR